MDAQLSGRWITDEGKDYRHSRLSEVRNAIFGSPYQTIWGGQGKPPLKADRHGGAAGHPHE